MKCWNCGKDLNLTSNKISFRATCDHCSHYLHCCKNCQNYKPGQPNDCLIPGTEYIADRMANNYCEDFALLGIGPTHQATIADTEQRLFGDVKTSIKPDKPEDRFNSLFKKD